MDEMRYTEQDGKAVLKTERENEWIESDSVFCLADWA
jgi:hypothetical protein